MNFEIRSANIDDVSEIAAAHRDSIHTLGIRYYSPEIVNDWSSGIKRGMYLQAMQQGELFFIAVADNNEVLGFSSHRIDDGIHGVSVYVRGKAARHGLGSALLSAAEASAITANAPSIYIDASLAAVDFYIANGFKEISRGEHQLSSGSSMACVYMRKDFQK